LKIGGQPVRRARTAALAMPNGQNASVRGVNRVLCLLAAAVCLLLGSILAVFALIGLVTKLTSIDARAILFIAGFGLAAFGCFWSANRLRRASLSKT
jgi:hypothetical protein